MFASLEGRTVHPRLRPQAPGRAWSHRVFPGPQEVGRIPRVSERPKSDWNGSIVGQGRGDDSRSETRHVGVLVRSRVLVDEEGGGRDPVVDRGGGWTTDRSTEGSSERKGTGQTSLRCGKPEIQNSERGLRQEERGNSQRRLERRRRREWSFFITWGGGRGVRVVGHVQSVT